MTLLEDEEQGFKIYKLEGPVSNPDSKDREVELLRHILEDARKSGVRVEWEIVKDHDFERFKSHAQKVGMILVDDDEVWEVYRS